jgi:hypothetical protein
MLFFWQTLSGVNTLTGFCYKHAEGLFSTFLFSTYHTPSGVNTLTGFCKQADGFL